MAKRPAKAAPKAPARKKTRAAAKAKPERTGISAAAARALMVSRDVGAPDTSTIGGTVRGGGVTVDRGRDPVVVADVNADKLRELTAENAKLSAAAEIAISDSRLAAAAAAKAARQVETLTAQNSALATDLKTAQAGLAKAEAEILQLKAAATKTKDAPLVLTADSVSDLLRDFVKSFDGALGSLRLGNTEIALKTGFVDTGGKAAFVLPSATAPADSVKNLHEVRMQLNPKIDG